MAAPAVDKVWALSVVGVEVLVGRLDRVSVDVDTSVDIGVVAGVEAVVVTVESDVLAVVAVVIPLSGADWDEPGQLKMDVPPGSGGGVLVQVLMSTTLLIWDISLAHCGVLQLWGILAG